jgi:hypothetical protein
VAKSGDWYQDLVGAVQRALDPGATVDVGVWVEGPDGRRDMDVSVRGEKYGQPHFALIECKDWKEPVGIAVIDAFDSKRRDLKADVAIVFSNSGFTQDAARKARRVGIQLASALREGDPAVHVEIVRTFVAKRHAVTRWVMVLCWRKERQGPDNFHPFDVEFQGLPLVNWIEQDSLRLLREHPSAKSIKAEHAFESEREFSVRKKVFPLTGFVYQIECDTGWVSQSVRENVTLGSYDFLTGRVIIPSQQAYILGPFDRDAWEPCDAPPEEPAEIEPGTFRLGLTLLAPVHGVDGVGVPDLDPLIKERLVTPA